MAHKKEKGLEVYNYDFDFKPSYNQLLKVFREMHANALGKFNKISLQRKMISKLNREVSNFNSALESIMEAHESLLNEQLYISNILEEKVVKM